MKIKKRNILCLDLFQGIFSSTMPIAIIAVSLLCCICILQLYPDIQNWGSISIINSLDVMIGLSLFKKILVIIAAAPFVASFCNDWNTQFIRPVIIRGGVRRYIWSKVFTCTVSSFTTVYMGVLLFFSVCSIWMDFYPQDMPLSFPAPFESLETSAFPFMYPFIVIFIFSMGCSIWVITGLLISSFIPNRFVAVITPLISSYIIEELTEGFPRWINLYYLTRAKNVINQGLLLSLMYYIFIFSFIIFCIGLIFSWQVKRRVKNEVI